MKVYDLLLTADNDLAIQAGDLVVGEATKQNQKLILQSNPGEWRESPTVGVGIDRLILDDAPSAAVTSTIQAQLEADGMVVDRLAFDKTGGIELAAYYRDPND